MISLKHISRLVLKSSLRLIDSYNERGRNSYSFYESYYTYMEYSEEGGESISIAWFGFLEANLKYDYLLLDIFDEFLSFLRRKLSAVKAILLFSIEFADLIFYWLTDSTGLIYYSLMEVLF
jgi:hypothetical protein